MSDTVSTVGSSSGFATHEVYNQSGELVDYDPYRGDRALHSAVDAFDGGWAAAKIEKAAKLVGSAEVQTLARQANKLTPELVTHDRFGHRVESHRLDDEPPQRIDSRFDQNSNPTITR